MWACAGLMPLRGLFSKSASVSIRSEERPSRRARPASKRRCRPHSPSSPSLSLKAFWRGTKASAASRFICTRGCPSVVAPPWSRTSPSLSPSGLSPAAPAGIAGFICRSTGCICGGAHVYPHSVSLSHAEPARRGPAHRPDHLYRGAVSAPAKHLQSRKGVHARQHHRGRRGVDVQVRLRLSPHHANEPRAARTRHSPLASVPLPAAAPPGGLPVPGACLQRLRLRREILQSPHLLGDPDLLAALHELERHGQLQLHYQHGRLPPLPGPGELRGDPHADPASRARRARGRRPGPHQAHAGLRSHPHAWGSPGARGAPLARAAQRPVAVSGWRLGASRPPPHPARR
ncbi:hypothetical protein [Equine adenovirus 1]|uniref:Uncharacterized protein n=1 Tax=Equine adenovirus A serotype 1 TaxID=46916 RepID=A0A1B0XBA7_ADEE1|nr:hypothetical protein [Equine adenovirus 1]